MSGSAGSERTLSSVTGNYPVVSFLVPLVSGIIAGRSFYSALLPWLMPLGLGVIAFAAVFILLIEIKTGRLTYVLTRVSLFLMFLFLGTFLTLRSLRSVLFPIAEKETVYGGIVEAAPKVHGRAVTLRVRISGYLEGNRSRAESGVILLTVPADSSISCIARGDAVIFSALLRRPENPGNPFESDYASYLIDHGIGAEAFIYPDHIRRASGTVASVLGVGDLSLAERMRLWGAGVRDAAGRAYQRYGFTGEELAVISAMTVGAGERLTRDVRDVFSQAGVSHVLALSGLHLGIIFAVLEFILAGKVRTRRRYVPSQFIIIAFIWTFAVVAGFPRSLVRACVMYSLMALCLVMRRDYSSLSSLLLTAFLMLLFSPLSLYDVGFRLSFLSVFSIIVIYPRIAPASVVMRSLAGRLWGMIAVSLSAQAATAPLVAYIFHSFPVYFVLSNLIAVPISSVVVSGGMLLLLISPVTPLASPLAFLLRGAVRLMEWLLSAVTSLPYASIPLYPSALTVALVYAAFAFLVLLLIKRREVFLFSLVLSLCVALVTNATERRAERQFAGVFFYRGAASGTVHFISPSGNNYIYAPPEIDHSLLERRTFTLNRDFWKRCRLHSPQRLGPSVENAEIRRRGSLILFGGKLYVILDSTVARRAVPSKLRAEAVYVVRGYSGDFGKWLERVKARYVILDPRLSPYRRKLFGEACRDCGVKPVDLAVSRAPVCGAPREEVSGERDILGIYAK